jgi:uncharacterized protein
VLELEQNNILDNIIKDGTTNFDLRNVYKSKIHGKEHNERVLFLASAIAWYEKIPKEWNEILIDGAKYHDIGRINDAWDTLHGKRGSEQIEKIVKYEKKEDLAILEFIIETNSINDSKAKDILNNYDINNKEKALILLNILKDADGLDRMRLDEEAGNSEYTASNLNPEYLRTAAGKQLIKAAFELYSFYIKNN